jgi:aldose 1-epimerase
MSEDSNSPMLVMKSFGVTSTDDEVFLYTLKNENGIRISISNYGGTVSECWVPDRKGVFADVALGYSDVESYIRNSPYFGAIIGRVGNRTGGASFEMDGVRYALGQTNAPGEKPIHLHGGIEGFDKKIWEPNPLIRNGEPVLELRYRSKSGEEGYPGNLDVLVTYTLTNADELRIDYHAVTDHATPINLTNHSYFNLKGEGKGDILGHIVRVAAHKIVEVDSDMVPTGKLLDVKGTPFDLNTPVTIGDKIDSDSVQLKHAGGFDHCHVLDSTGGTLAWAAEVYEPESGRVIEVLTEEPGIQFYCGNWLDGSCIGKSGISYGRRHGFCLETQHFPNSINHKAFPSTILRPGETYETTTLYRFSTR